MSKISIITLNLFRSQGDRLVLGGLERYTRDLAFLCRKMGYKVDIHQHGTHDWENDLDGIPVYGYGISSKNQYEMVREANRNSSKNVIYTWIGQQQKETDYKRSSISISHGIWWDLPTAKLKWVEGVKPFILNACNGSKYVVSVDTNFLGYVRATFPTKCKNIKYIPNYADKSIFYPSKLFSKRNEKVTVLYPRRLDKVRGIDTAKEICNYILKKYDFVDFIFAIDNNHDNLWKNFSDWVNKSPYKDRIFYNNYSYDEIAEVYRKADIVILPTLACEGTSLSGLEAMASGNAIVTTNVGGLNDLFIDNFNALVTHPNEKDLFIDNVCYLIENNKYRNYLAENAYNTSEAFSKDIWESKWADLIKITFKE
ncbi:MAG: glycosyltransferase family 4 protein [bacterium]